MSESWAIQVSPEGLAPMVARVPDPPHDPEIPPRDRHQWSPRHESPCVHPRVRFATTLGPVAVIGPWLGLARSFLEFLVVSWSDLLSLSSSSDRRSWDSPPARDRYRACDHCFVSNAPASGVQRLAIIAVDFHRLRQRPDPEVAPQCAQAAALRLRRSLQSSTDEEDRRSIGFALQLGGACSTATVASGRHAPGLSGSGPSTSRCRLW